MKTGKYGVPLILVPVRKVGRVIKSKKAYNRKRAKRVEV